MATKLTDNNVSAIDQAIANAKNRKAAREGTSPAASSATTPAATKAPKPAKEPSAPKRPRLSDEEKAARDEARNKERAEKRAARAAARETKKLEKAASRQPAHMRKVMKAAEKLGTLAQASQLLFNEATASLTAAELATLALHIQHFNRIKATERALVQTIEAGQTVTIVGGDPRFIGQTGTVTKAQRIRCYVQVEGSKKPVYLFTSDVAPVAAAPSSQTAVG